MKLELVSKMVGVKTKMKLKLRGMKCRKKDNTCATLLDTLNGAYVALCFIISLCYRIKIQPAGYHKDKPAGCITFPRQKVHPSFVAFP